MTDSDQPARGGMNLNTWISAAGFTITILIGSAALGRFQADTELRLNAAAIKVAELQIQQTATASRFDSSILNLEAAINALNIRDARNDERMNSILETLRRIDAKIDAQETRENGGKP